MAKSLHLSTVLNFVKELTVATPNVKMTNDLSEKVQSVEFSIRGHKRVEATLI